MIFATEEMHRSSWGILAIPGVPPTPKKRVNCAK